MKKKLEDYILEVVHQNSGGVKFLELLTDVASAALEGQVDANALDGNFPDILEETVTKMDPKVKVLRYGWCMDKTGIPGSIQREKIFVYSPLQGE